MLTLTRGYPATRSMRASEPTRLGAVASALTVLCIAGAALAHTPERQIDREMVRLQGYRALKPADATIVGELDLNVLGTDHHFYLTAWQRFGVETAATPSPPDSHLALQGERADLIKVGSARPSQRVTILGERRPGAHDLFLLALDLCPEK